MVSFVEKLAAGIHLTVMRMSGIALLASGGL
jgi:hypothetical protein